MNEDNLIPFSERSKEEARELGRKGGIASGETRRRKRALKEELMIALELTKDGKTLQEIGVEALMQKFMAGDIQAFTTVRDTIGEKPTDKLEANVGVTTVKVDVIDE